MAYLMAKANGADEKGWRHRLDEVASALEDGLRIQHDRIIGGN